MDDSTEDENKFSVEDSTVVTAAHDAVNRYSVVPSMDVNEVGLT